MNSNEEIEIQHKIDLYLSNTMSESERLLFEEQMESSPDLKKQVLLQKSICEVLFENEFDHVKDEEKEKELAQIKSTLQTKVYQKHQEHLTSTTQVYHKTRQRRRLLLVSSIAAAILALTSIFLFPTKDTFETIYAEYADWDQLTSYVEQSDANEFSKGEILYQDEKYIEAIQFFEIYTKDQNKKLYAPGLMYLGASYFANDNVAEALETYDLLVKSDSYDNSKGHWYKLLIYLKQKDTSQVNKTLEVILSNQNNYNYQKAEEIKKSL